MRDGLINPNPPPGLRISMKPPTLMQLQRKLEKEIKINDRKIKTLEREIYLLMKEDDNDSFAMACVKNIHLKTLSEKFWILRSKLKEVRNAFYPAS